MLTLPYAIEFENDQKFANASAHRIVVTDILDPNLFDVASICVKKIIVSDKEIELNENDSFIRTVDMRPAQNAIANIEFKVDKSRGILVWILQALDPMTMKPTLEVEKGILPVNRDGEGIGQILFEVKRKEDLNDGTKISNFATIVFDDNAPIETPVWTNVIDRTPPTSRIINETKVDDKFVFEVEGEDALSGIWCYDLMARKTGNSQYQVVKSTILTDKFEYSADDDSNFSDFKVVAIDHAGNRQSENIEILYGDADGNGVVDSNDVVAMRNYYLEKGAEINKLSSDVNKDGLIDAQDALGTRNIYLDTEITSKHLRARRTK